MKFREKFQYSNIMYEIIPNALEHITNIPFTEYVKKEHFDPLGMGATSYKADGLTAMQDIIPSLDQGERPKGSSR